MRIHSAGRAVVSLTRLFVTDLLSLSAGSKIEMPKLSLSPNGCNRACVNRRLIVAGAALT